MILFRNYNPKIIKKSHNKKQYQLKCQVKKERVFKTIIYLDQTIFYFRETIK